MLTAAMRASPGTRIHLRRWIPGMCMMRSSLGAAARRALASESAGAKARSGEGEAFAARVVSLDALFEGTQRVGLLAEAAVAAANTQPEVLHAYLLSSDQESSAKGKNTEPASRKKQAKRAVPAILFPQQVAQVQDKLVNQAVFPRLFAFDITTHAKVIKGLSALEPPLLQTYLRSRVTLEKLGQILQLFALETSPFFETENDAATYPTNLVLSAAQAQALYRCVFPMLQELTSTRRHRQSPSLEQLWKEPHASTSADPTRSLDQTATTLDDASESLLPPPTPLNGRLAAASQGGEKASLTLDATTSLQTRSHYAALRTHLVALTHIGCVGSQASPFDSVNLIRLFYVKPPPYLFTACLARLLRDGRISHQSFQELIFAFHAADVDATQHASFLFHASFCHPSSSANALGERAAQQAVMTSIVPNTDALRTMTRQVIKDVLENPSAAEYQAMLLRSLQAMITACDWHHHWRERLHHPTASKQEEDRPGFFSKSTGHGAKRIHPDDELGVFLAEFEADAEVLRQNVACALDYPFVTPQYPDEDGVPQWGSRRAPDFPAKEFRGLQNVPSDMASNVLSALLLFVMSRRDATCVAETLRALKALGSAYHKAAERPLIDYLATQPSKACIYAWADCMRHDTPAHSVEAVLLALQKVTADDQAIFETVQTVEDRCPKLRGKMWQIVMPLLREPSYTLVERICEQHRDELTASSVAFYVKAKLDDLASQASDITPAGLFGPVLGSDHDNPMALEPLPIYEEAVKSSVDSMKGVGSVSDVLKVTADSNANNIDEGHAHPARDSVKNRQQQQKQRQSLNDTAELNAVSAEACYLLEAAFPREFTRIAQDSFYFVPARDLDSNGNRRKAPTGPPRPLSGERAMSLGDIGALLVRIKQSDYIKCNDMVFLSQLLAYTETYIKLTQEQSGHTSPSRSFSDSSSSDSSSASATARSGNAHSARRQLRDLSIGSTASAFHSPEYAVLAGMTRSRQLAVTTEDGSDSRMSSLLSQITEDVVPQGSQTMWLSAAIGSLYLELILLTQGSNAFADELRSLPPAFLTFEGLGAILLRACEHEDAVLVQSVLSGLSRSRVASIPAIVEEMLIDVPRTDPSSPNSLGNSTSAARERRPSSPLGREALQEDTAFSRLSVAQKMCLHKALLAAKVPLRPELHTRIIKSIAESGQVEPLFESIVHMKKAGLKYSIPAYRVILYAFAQRGYFSAAKKTFSMIAQQLKRPNVALFNPLFYAVSSEADLNEVQPILERMNELQVEPNAETFLILARKHLRFGMAEKAVNLLSAIPMNKLPLTPAAVSTWISAMGQADEYPFNAISSVYYALDDVALGHVDPSIYEVVAKAVAKQLSRTYGELLDEHAIPLWEEISLDAPDARKLVRHLYTHHSQNSRPSFLVALLESCQFTADTGLVNSIMEDLRSLLHELPFDYAITAAAAANDTETMMQYYREMRGLTKTPVRNTYAAMIAAYGRKKNISDAMDVYDDMIDQEIYPDHTLNRVLIEVCNIDRASVIANAERFERMQQQQQQDRWQ